jgi:sterol desaturase/sphingolipid hydroxylase (fatty acid hydroxylase superfamily)
MQGQPIRNMISALPATMLRMSRSPVNYWAEFGLDIPLGVILIFAGLRHDGIRPTEVLLIFLLGLFIFSYLEYSVHRWLFHGSIQIIAQGHDMHHKNPMGYDALPFFIPSLVILGLAGIFALLMPVNDAFLLSGTMAVGYVAYGLGHFSIHHVRFHQPLARQWAAHHHIHHYHPESNFGVTTPLWDLLLGTGYVVPHHKEIQA